MNLLKNMARMFQGAPSDIGLYYYVKCQRCGEVIQVRINPNNDLTVEYGDASNPKTDTFFAHKMLVGQRCYNRMEADFYFDKGRHLSDKKVTGGKFVEQAEFEADQRAQQTLQSSE